jgi:hypothetical protein
MRRKQQIKITNNKMCECGHTLGNHNIPMDRCLTYPYEDEPYKICNCKGFKELEKKENGNK